ncbi:MAG: hypothetical protein GW848_01685 [Rhodoferax sp.]|nr:hypothetical protein [Rhodoferax sp.]OIP24002.1 MAG: hypothetical protein AUK52_03495 [Comamonadaceae bacterium CG2_30_60_41]PIW06378.1 MAG: hypothetical protein COW39_17340 [Comamonadaceae bacterium CG17_big_fil_post_rev_8_21_14_2_50_60_13]PIY24261.1 MAG: hypothetical protein COZ10_07510 [Comamonadaceae bacterium CG_4_10_14_3_um_filter_60_75]PJC11404.1 MAG: hypothetical protein CO066_15800 [Comamonadaceae bacterium CG_4_9_14_0_8_um_filter_60_18]
MIRSLLRIGLSLFFALSLPSHSHAQAPTKCVTSLADLKVLLGDPGFPLQWEETTMDDGKPLRVAITEKDGALSVAFVKTSRGLWADISGSICKTEQALEIRFTAEQIHFGPSASWILRYVLGSGGQFTLTRTGPQQMRVSTTGWSGMFVPVAKP